MAANHVRVDADTHRTLSQLARAKQMTLADTLAEAVEAYRRQHALGQFCAEYAALDDKALAEEREEAGAWDSTSADGLDGQ